jgi:hypothetical protein
MTRNINSLWLVNKTAQEGLEIIKSVAKIPVTYEGASKSFQTGHLEQEHGTALCY